MQALKALVIGLGILVAVGMGILVYGLVQKASDPNFSFFAAREAAPAPAEAGAAAFALKPFGDVMVPLPAGCRAEDMRADGTRLFVRVGPAGSCARIVVVDLVGGRVLGNVKFWEAP